MKRALFSVVVFGMIFLFPWQAGAYEVAAVSDGGVVTGKITFEGTPPSPKTYLITKDNNVCGTGQIKRQEVDVKDGALRGVVVYFEKVKKGKPFPKEAAKPVIDQKKCTYVPYIQVAQNKSKLTILNSDPVLHNIHSYELIGTVRRSMFNIAQPKSKPRASKKLRMKRTGHVRIECDAHDWMLAWIYVAQNPYYATVGKDGSFRISDIPPGNYTMKAWHPVLGVQKKKVQVKAKGKASVSFRFTSK